MPTTQQQTARLSPREARKRFLNLRQEINRGNSALINQLLIRVGLAALKFIYDAFKVKSAGATDVTGLRWQPLREDQAASHQERWRQAYDKGMRAGLHPSTAARGAWLHAGPRPQKRELILDASGRLRRSLEPPLAPGQGAAARRTRTSRFSGWAGISSTSAQRFLTPSFTTRAPPSAASPSGGCGRSHPPGRGVCGPVSFSSYAPA
jgi:hypothetical protein